MINEGDSILRDVSEGDGFDEGPGEDKLAQIIDFLPDAILAIDLNGKVIAWNRAMEEMTGVKVGDILGRGDYEYSLPFYGKRRPILIDLALRSDPSSEAEYSSLKREGKAVVGEIFISTFGKNGSYIWAKATPLYDRSGNMIGAIESIRDITERKREEEKAARIIEFLPDATFVINTDGIVIAWNKALEEMTGVKAQDILGKGNYEHSIPFYKTRRPVLADLALKPEGELESRYSNLQRDGKSLVGEVFIPTFGNGGAHIWAKATPLFDDYGNIIGAIESIRDITERKRTEVALHESEERFRTMMEQSPIATAIFNASGILVDANSAAESMFRQKAGALAGWYSILKDSQLRMAGIPAYFNRALEGEAVSVPDFEYVIHTSESCSKKRWLKARIYPIKDKDEKVLSIVSAFEDITDRKRAEQKMADIIDFLPDATFVRCLDGTVIAWNRAMEKMTGVKARDILGKGNYEYALPFYGERRPILVDMALRSDRDLEAEYSNLRREGTALMGETFIPTFGQGGSYIWCKATPLFDSAGNITGAVESIRDITENKRAQLAIEESKKRMADIIQFLPDATLVIDTSGRVVAWNKAMEELTGTKAENVLGKGNYQHAVPFYGLRRPILVDMALKPSKELEAEYSQLSEEGNALVGEVFIPTFGESGLYIWCKATPLIDSSGNIIGAIESIRDITERKRTEAALLESEERFRTMMEQSPISMAIFNTEGTLVDANSASKAMFGKRAGSVIGWYNILKDGQLRMAGIPAYFKKALDGEAVSVPDFEYVLHTSESCSKKRWLKARMYPIKDGDGKVLNVVSAYEDITARKRAEQKMADIIDFLPDATFVRCLDGTVIAWNKAMEKMTGVKARDILGKGNYEYSLPFYGERRPILVDMALKTDCNLESEYIQLKREGSALVGEVFIPTFGKDGSYIWCKATPLFDNAGNITGAIESIRDVTERKREEQKIAAIIEFLPDAALVIDNVGKAIAWNKAMVEMTGTKAEYILGKGNYEYALPFYGSRRPMLADLALKPKDELEKEYDHFEREGDDTIMVETFNPRIKGGRGAYVWAKALPLRDSSGVVIGAIETIRDITERKLAEQALHKSEREKEAILGGLRKVAVEYLDDKMRIIWINEAVQKRLGLSIDELRGKYCYEAIQGLSKPCLGCKVVETLRTGESKEGELITPDGRAWEARSNPIRNDEGRITGVVQVAMNITERKRAEQKMADIINFLPDATFVIDSDGVVIAWNRAMEALTGVQACQILGKGNCEYSIPIYGTRRRILIDLVLKSDEMIEGKYDSVEKEGNTIITEVFVPSFKPGGAYLWAKASPLYDPNGKLIGAIETIRDVTERRQIEQKLERSKAELQIAAEIQKSFMPDHTPSVSQFKLAAVTIPAMEVGGDFYDFISLPDGKQGLVIADVAGKSIPAALFMALSRTIVRANAAHQPQTAEVLREANNMIAQDASAGMFVTLFYGVLDGKAHTLTYANAGHPPLLVFRTGCCKCAEQEVTGVALGAMDGMEYEERQVKFRPGDVAVLYTDGVTEAVNSKGELYGIGRLCSVMTRNSHLSAQEIMEKVLDDISEFSQDMSQYDDITMVVLKAE